MAKIAERLAYLEAVIGADITQFRKGMRDIRNETGILSEVTRGITGFGRTLTFAYTTPLLVMGTTAIQTASEFESAMRNINSIAGMSEGALADLSARTLEFGKTTRSGAIASAEALYTVFSAGIMDTDDAFALMNTSVKTSEAGLADLTTTTNALISIMLSYGDTSEAMANRSSDALTRMVQVGVGSMDAFASSIGGVMPAASAAGMSIEDLFGDLAFLTQRGMSAAQAGVSMNAVLKKLISPTEAMSAAFHELGGDNLPELIDQFGSVNEVIEALITNADGDLTELFAMFNTTQGQRAIAQFASNMEQWQTAQSDFNEGMQGATASAWEQQMKSFAASWDLLKSAVQGAGIAIGQTMMPVLQPIIKGLADLINQVSSANPEILGMGVAFLAVSAAIPPLLWLLGSLLSPIGLIIGGIAALAVAFETNFAGIKDSVMNSIGGIVADLQPLITAVEDFWNALFPEDLQAAISGGTEPVELDPYDYIIVTEPKSLWDVYVENGYDQQFSWQEFMDEALAGGWQGGAVTPDEPIRIRPRFELELQTQGSRAEDAGLRQLANQAFDVPASIIVDPFTNAMQVGLPRVQAAFLDFIGNAFPALTIGDTSMQETLDIIGTFIDDIRAEFNLEDADLTGVQDLFTGIKSAVDELANADWSGVAKIGVILAVFTTGAINSALTVVGGLFTTIGTGLANFVNSLAAFGNGDEVDGLALLSGALLDLGIALLQIPAGVFDTIIGGLEKLLGFDIGSLSEFLGELRETIQAEVEDIINAPDRPVINAMDLIALDYGGSNVTEAGKFINSMLSESVGQLEFTPSWLFGGTGERPEDWLMGDSGAIPNNFVIPLTGFDPASVTQALQNLNALIASSDVSEGARAIAQQTRDTLIYELQQRGLPIPPDAFLVPDHIVMPDGTVIQLGQFVFDTSTATPTETIFPTTQTELDASGVVNFTPTTTTITTGEQVVTTDSPLTVTPTTPVTVDMANVSLATSEAMLSGEDAQTIIDMNFVPIQDAWVAMYAADGLMATSFSAFSTDVATGWTTIGTAVNTFNTDMGVIIPNITSILTTSTPTWATALDPFLSKVQQTKDAINSLISTIKQLMSMQGSFSIDVNFTGTGADLDGNHKTGLDTVPFDGYIAELHKGERVLTAREASQMDEDENYRSSVAIRTPSHTDNSSTVVNINGVQNVDALLFEMKRRGIKLK